MLVLEYEIIDRRQYYFAGWNDYNNIIRAATARAPTSGTHVATLRLVIIIVIIASREPHASSRVRIGTVMVYLYQWIWQSTGHRHACIKNDGEIVAKKPKRRNS